MEITRLVSQLVVTSSPTRAMTTLQFKSVTNVGSLKTAVTFLRCHLHLQVLRLPLTTMFMVTKALPYQKLVAELNYETYGVLYNWPAVMTEGICPSGWHIPSDEEFTQLTDFLGGEECSRR